MFVFAATLVVFLYHTPFGRYLNVIKKSKVHMTERRRRRQPTTTTMTTTITKINGHQRKDNANDGTVTTAKIANKKMTQKNPQSCTTQSFEMNRHECGKKERIHKCKFLDRN